MTEVDLSSLGAKEQAAPHRWGDHSDAKPHAIRTVTSFSYHWDDPMQPVTLALESPGRDE
jgi:hypothetical protein